jgi:hypothetical protein
MKNTLEGVWIVEYSGSQDCFHMEEANSRITSSIGDCIKKQKRDWYTVGIFASSKDAGDAIDALKQKQENNG